MNKEVIEKIIRNSQIIESEEKIEKYHMEFAEFNNYGDMLIINVYDDTDENANLQKEKVQLIGSYLAIQNGYDLVLKYIKINDTSFYETICYRYINDHCIYKVSTMKDDKVTSIYRISLDTKQEILDRFTSKCEDEINKIFNYAKEGFLEPLHVLQMMINLYYQYLSIFEKEAKKELKNTF